MTASPLTAGEIAADGSHHVWYRVYFEETDAGGIMYHGNYLNMCERARTEWLRHAGFQQHLLMQTEGVGFVVRRAEVDYLKPAFLDDSLRVRTRLVEAGRSSMILQQDIDRLPPDAPADTAPETIAGIKIVLVCINAAKRPVRIPTEIIDALQKPAHSLNR